MAIQCYGSLEAYQKSQEPVPPVVIDPAPASTDAHSPNNVHYISTAAPVKGASSPNSSSPAGSAPDFWERRRMFRRSIFEKWTLRRWLPSPAVTNGGDTAAGAANKPAARRASTTYGGSTSNVNATAVANKNRRASTSLV